MLAIAEEMRARTAFLMESQGAQSAKRQILAQAQRFQAARASYRCCCCRGRCDVEVQFSALGIITHSKGECRTPGCLAWEE